MEDTEKIDSVRMLIQNKIVRLKKIQKKNTTRMVLM